MRSSSVIHATATTQGAFYVATGVWPIVHAASFQYVTGPKTDVWLVQTFGALLAVLGALLLVKGLRKETGSSEVALGVGAAAVLAIADIYFAGRGVISAVYLADAAAEMALIVGWAVGRARAHHAPMHRPLSSS
jgi:hypothetical protein